MSFLHITHKDKKATIHLDDGKSDLLDRYVDLDDGTMYYTMGKQISGKPINPNGKTGREILRIAEYWVNNPETEWKPVIFSREASTRCFIITAAYGLHLEHKVLVFRSFRDNILLNSKIGRAFVVGYYVISPPIAKLISQSNCLCHFAQTMLSPLSRMARILLRKNGIVS